MPEQGCNVEVTKIRANFQAAHYTFALEAFGKGVDLKKISTWRFVKFLKTIQLTD